MSQCRHVPVRYVLVTLCVRPLVSQCRRVPVRCVLVTLCISPLVSQCRRVPVRCVLVPLCINPLVSQCRHFSVCCVLVICRSVLSCPSPLCPSPFVYKSSCVSVPSCPSPLCPSHFVYQSRGVKAKGLGTRDKYALGLGHTGPGTNKDALTPCPSPMMSQPRGNGTRWD